MIIEKVELTGFGSYRDHTIINFQMGITAIVGTYSENSKRSNGCLTGDMIINFNRAKLGRKKTLKSAYESFSQMNKGYPKGWDLSIPTLVRSYKEDQDIIRLHEIEKVVYSGKKEVYRIELENGLFLKGTFDHEIMTKKGFVELGKLKINESEIMCDTLKASKKTNVYKDHKYQEIYTIPFHPYATKKTKDKSASKGFSKYSRLPIHRLIYEANLNNLSYDDFIDIIKNDEEKSKTLQYLDIKIYDIHHKDWNHKNNDINNLECLTKIEHQLLHSKVSQFHFHQGIPQFSKIISIEYMGIEDTYDIICKEPYRNFVANGIVVHNSGKSTIIMSILYAIYGEGSYNTLSELVNDNVDSMSVKLFFQLSENEYIIERGIQKKSSYLDFFQNGNRIGKSIDETQKEINNIMGMDYNEFSSSIFFEQGRLDKFINVTADKRREYIDKVLGLEIWRNLGKEATKTKKGYEKDFIALSEERDSLKDIIEQIIPSINQKSVIEAELNINNDKKLELNSIINKYNESYQNQIKLEGIKNQIKSSEEFISNTKDKLKLEQNKIFDVNKYDAKIDELNKGIAFSKESLINVEKEFIRLNTEYDELNKNKLGFNLNVSQVTMEIENQRKHKNHILSGTCPTCKQMVDTQLLENENLSIDEMIGKMNIQLKEQQGLLNELETKLTGLLKIIGETGTLKNNISMGISKDENEVYKLELDKKQEIENEKKQKDVIKFIETELEGLLTNLSNLIIERDSIVVEKFDIDIKTIQNQILNIDKIINGLNIKLGSIINEEKRKEEIQKKLEIIKKDIDTVEKNVYIYTILSDSYIEIPKKLFLESVTLIEEESNKLIQQIMPNLSVRIYEDEKKKNNPLVISFIENGNDRSYARLSGGLKAICNICIRLAFSFIIMHKARVSLNFLVLDEIFSELDQENRELVKSIFPVLSSFFKQIILITHTDDLNEFPNILTIGKTIEGISYIK